MQTESTGPKLYYPTLNRWGNAQITVYSDPRAGKVYLQIGVDKGALVELTPTYAKELGEILMRESRK